MNNSQSGSSLLELVTTLAITALLVGMSVPTLDAARRLALRSEAHRLAMAINLLQLDAAGLTGNRGIRFEPSATSWTYTVYDDGDDDGVQSADIATGIDRAVAGPFQVGDGMAGHVHIGFPLSGVPDPDTGEALAPTSMAVNFNRSRICSFSPGGSSTPGSVYLTDGLNAAMVRCSGANGTIRVLFYDPSKRTWR